MGGQRPLFVDIGSGLFQNSPLPRYFLVSKLFSVAILLSQTKKSCWRTPLNRPSAVQGSGESIPVFHRRVSPGNSKLTESLCSGCNAFVAASVNPKLLDLVERSHTCSGSRKN